MGLTATDWPHASDPAAVDAHYNLRAHPDRERVYADFSGRSSALLLSHPDTLNQAYAAHPRARLDVFTATDPIGVLVFFHGGYWRALNRRIFTFIAQPFLARRLTVVMPDYPLAPQATLGEIVEHAKLAMAWATEHIAQRESNALPIVVSGHSAGGHLAALCASAVPHSNSPVACIPISGLFDLAPIVHTNVNQQLRLSAADINSYSPARLPCEHAPATLVVAGGAETPGFQWQSEIYSQHLQDQNVASDLFLAENLNHFTILEALTATDTPLHNTVMRFIHRQVQADQ